MRWSGELWWCSTNLLETEIIKNNCISVSHKETKMYESLVISDFRKLNCRVVRSWLHLSLKKTLNWKVWISKISKKKITIPISENSEQLESALSEMAAQLENAKIDHDDMKDLHESLTGHKWVDEKTVKICYKCERDFTIKRRKVNFPRFILSIELRNEMVVHWYNSERLSRRVSYENIKF